jgi:hypothetical protein
VEVAGVEVILSCSRAEIALIIAVRCMPTVELHPSGFHPAGLRDSRVRGTGVDRRPQCLLALGPLWGESRGSLWPHPCWWVVQRACDAFRSCLSLGLIFEKSSLTLVDSNP